MSVTITFIGAGNMATSLAGGLIAKGYPAAAITLTDVDPQALQRAREQWQVNTSQDNLSACQAAEVILLAVKPQVMSTVVPPLATLTRTRKPLVISIAAGVTLAQLEAWLGAEVPIVRCMPNILALVQTGAAGLFANPHLTPSQRAQAQSIIAAVGLALWVESEDQIDAVTALSGSGPAYFFRVMEAMIAAGCELGLAPEVARQLTLQTALGAARMALASTEAPAELRRRVTSPGGTTEKALTIMEEGNLPAIFTTAIKGAYERAKELAGTA